MLCLSVRSLARSLGWFLDLDCTNSSQNGAWSGGSVFFLKAKRGVPSANFNFENFHCLTITHRRVSLVAKITYKVSAITFEQHALRLQDNISFYG